MSNSVIAKTRDLIALGQLEKCEQLLSKELSKLPDSPFHAILAETFGRGLAVRFRKFCVQQAKRFDLKSAVFEVGDITADKQWVYRMLAYTISDESVEGLLRTDPAGLSQVKLIQQMFRVERGFAVRYQKKQHEKAGELARFLVTVKLYQLMSAEAEFLSLEGLCIFATVKGTDTWIKIRNGVVQERPKSPQPGDKAFERDWKKICKRVEKRLGRKTPVRFAAYRSSAAGLPVDNLDSIAINGRAIIVAEPEPEWGGKESKGFQSEILQKPTWLDLCEVLKQQTERTRDLQHVYLEGVSKIGQKTIDGVRVNQYTLRLGS